MKTNKSIMTEPLRLNIQHFAAEPNLITTPDLGTVNSIDFVNRFGNSISKLQQALGVTRPTPLRQGNKIAMYKFTLTPPADADAAKGIVAEGEDIPLTHVGRELDREVTVPFRKYRKAVTIEEVQRVGYEVAVNQTDRRVLQKIQKDVRTDFFTFLGTAPTTIPAVNNMQQAFGAIWGKVADLFDDEEAGVIVFVNPIDAGNYLGNAVIENGASVGFGLTLLQGFTNVTVFVNNSVPEGEVYGTARDNLNIAYIDANGEISKLFQNKPIITDETGLIGMVHDDNTNNLTHQSTVFTGTVLFAEIVDGVVKTTIEEPAPDAGA